MCEEKERVTCTPYLVVPEISLYPRQPKTRHRFTEKKPIFFLIVHHRTFGAMVVNGHRKRYIQIMLSAVQLICDVYVGDIYTDRVAAMSPITINTKQVSPTNKQIYKYTHK